MHFENKPWRLPSPLPCAIRPLLETAAQEISAQEIPADTFTDLPPNWDKEYDSIFSEKEQRSLQIQVTHKLQVKIYLDSLGHCNNRLLTHSLKKMGVSTHHLLPYINTYKCNVCTVNSGCHGYLLTTITDSIISTKDTVPTPLLTNTSVLNPEPILDVSVIIDQSVLVSDSLLPITLPEVPLVVTPVSTFVEPILDVRPDFADSCQIDHSDNRWFFVIGR